MTISRDAYEQLRQDNVRLEERCDALEAMTTTPNRKDFEEIGWNTPGDGSPVFERALLALLSKIGIVLAQIRDRIPGEP